MYPMNEFIDRNKDSYKKVGDVPKYLIDKYKGVAPDELIYIWEKMGFGIYEDGFLQLINPDEYNFLYEYVDEMLKPTIFWGITALGDVLAWEGSEGWTIAPKEGNRCFRIDVRKGNKTVIDNMEGILNIFINNFDGDDFFLRDKDFFDAKPYLDIKDKLPKLKYVNAMVMFQHWL